MQHLGRLAIDEKWQGRGLGKALLQDVVQRSVRATKEVSVRLFLRTAIRECRQRWPFRIDAMVFIDNHLHAI